MPTVSGWLGELTDENHEDKRQKLKPAAALGDPATIFNRQCIELYVELEQF